MVQALESIKNVPNWVCWKEVPGKRNKPLKLPINPHNGRAADTSDSTTWGTYTQAKKAYHRYGGMSGLGFVFTKDLGIVGIDLDDCVMSDGTITTRARRIIDAMQSYTEISHSGEGIHILAKGSIPDCIKRENIGVEMYDCLRYFTVTGRIMDNMPDTIAPRQPEIDRLYHMYRTNDTDGITIETVRDMLRYIPPSGLSYGDEWIKVLMAIHSHFPGSDGLQAAKEWTEHTSNPGEIDQKWASFGRTSKSGIRIGTLCYIAKGYGWEKATSDLDSIHPPLSQSQREQVTKIIDSMVERRLWDIYFNNMDTAKRATTGYSDDVIDHFRIGYCPSESAYTVPYRDINGNVVNLEYRKDNGSFIYEVDTVSHLFYSYPMYNTEHANRAIITPDSFSAITTYLKHGTINDMSFWGLPHHNTVSPQDISNSIDHIIVIVDETVDLAKLRPLAKRARFLVMPMNVNAAIDELSTAELKRMINMAEKYDRII